MISDTQVDSVESERLYYKLVRNDGAHLTSICLTGMFPCEYITTYEVGVETFPNVEGTKLFVVQGLVNALNILTGYSQANSSLELWTCEVKNPGDIHVIRMSDIDKYWTYTKKKQSINLIPLFGLGQDDGRISVQTIPKSEGTIGVDSVILRERIR